MKETLEVITLPTKEIKIGSIVSNFDELLAIVIPYSHSTEDYIMTTEGGGNPIHVKALNLYLTSKEYITKGVWVLIKIDDKWEVQRAIEDFPSVHHCRKILATTDSTLGLLPIPQSFIEDYVDKEGKIKTVDIRMESKEIDCPDGIEGCEVSHQRISPKLDSNGCVIIVQNTHIDHELKSWVGLFEPIFKGEKTHDFRVMDRDVQIGHVCLLREYEPMTKTYTGREVTVKITYITSSKHQECAFSPTALHPATAELSITKIEV